VINIQYPRVEVVLYKLTWITPSPVTALGNRSPHRAQYIATILVQGIAGIKKGRCMVSRAWAWSQAQPPESPDRESLELPGAQ
jgi:hypothetical protein